MKLAINIIGVFAVVIMTILGIFLIPFLTWATEIDVLHIILFVINILFLVISIIGFIVSIIKKKCFVDKFFLILLYVSLGGFIPSLITCIKFEFCEANVEGELLASSNSYYSKFGSYRMRADSKALDEYGDMFFIKFDQLDSKDYKNGERWISFEYKIYDANGDIVSAGDFDYWYWYYPRNPWSERYEYGGDYYSSSSDVERAAQKDEMEDIGLRIIEEWY